MTEKKRIFLLGGTGFIGSVLTKQLSANRHENDLMMLIHRSACFRELEQINTNTGSLGSFDLSMLDRFKPDTIVHMARMSGRGRWGRYLAAWRGARANRRILEHLRRQDCKAHVIYISGTLVYGDCGAEPVDESRPLNPIAFAREYIRAERPWMDALDSNSQPVTILRPPWILGRESWFEGFYLNSIRTQYTVPLFGEGRNLMSFIDVEDCAGLIAHAVQHAQPGRCYNLFAPGACIAQLDFAEKLAGHTGARIRRYSAAEIERIHGRTLWEALTFSNKSSTQHPEFIAGYKFKYPSVDEIILNNINIRSGQAISSSP